MTRQQRTALTFMLFMLAFYVSDMVQLHYLFATLEILVAVFVAFIFVVVAES